MKGHLRRRGNAWELRAYAGIDPISRRQKYVTRAFSGGKREAEQALARLVAEVSGGGHAARDATVGDLVFHWLDLVKDDLSPSTVRGYQRIIRCYIEPCLADIALSKLKTAQLDAFYSKLKEKGGQRGSRLAPATVRQTHAILRRALQQGVRWGWISTNPAVLATPPRLRRTQLTTPSPDDVVRLIEVASSEDPDFGCFLQLAATTGARRGELCGLRWSDIDLDASNVAISRNIVEGSKNELFEKDTKTHTTRRIALDEGTAGKLAKLHQQSSARARECGSQLRSDAYVFSPVADGLSPLTPNETTKRFERLRRRAGLDNVRLHDLRHFAATRLLAAGIPVRTVSGRLGHANAATTLGVYAHFLEESDQQAAATLGALVSPKESRPSPRLHIVGDQDAS